jgi:anaerobic selenocysteine-containing dehydrogenase
MTGYQLEHGATLLASESISFCRMCPSLCGIKVTVENGVVTRLAGDPDHPLSRRYVCPKGRKMVAPTDDRLRLNEPVLRHSRGDLVPVDGETAIGDLAPACRLRFGGTPARPAALENRIDDLVHTQT